MFILLKNQQQLYLVPITAVKGFNRGSAVNSMQIVACLKSHVKQEMTSLWTEEVVPTSRIDPNPISFMDKQHLAVTD